MDESKEADKTIEPLEWWRKNSTRYPTIARAARTILATPATSAMSEKAFSSCGFIINQRRCSISPEYVNELLLNAVVPVLHVNTCNSLDD